MSAETLIIAVVALGVVIGCCVGLGHAGREKNDGGK